MDSELSRVMQEISAFKSVNTDAQQHDEDEGDTEW